MRFGHPGMQRGTYQNGLARGMQQGLKETLVNAALAPLGEADILAEEGIAGEAAAEEDAAAEAAAAAPPPVPCFVAGTPVQMADGTTKAIEQVKTGDTVWSRDPTTGRTEAKKVLATKVHTAHALVTLTLADGQTGQVERIVCTPQHPFYVDGRGFVAAGQLAVGTSIVTRAGPPLVVTATEQAKADVPVYNFTVADDHTYFVGIGHGGAWVHNDCTIIGLRNDTEQYFGQPGYNVLKIPNWTWDDNLDWLRERYESGDTFALVSDPDLINELNAKGIGGKWTLAEFIQLNEWIENEGGIPIIQAW